MRLLARQLRNLALRSRGDPLLGKQRYPTIRMRTSLVEPDQSTNLNSGGVSNFIPANLSKITPLMIS